ncbi:hypothetical protein PIIN_08623 [Serendipita indica DSM 11827]|uniref:Uncharacterized protein n=1 Tax=Serendipita indica (strain DSM 11827) TaxID=1109443 RepID=G4TTM9_SERID|nr:hypothetical protein PIIN_08623 [Serendipita indica DSM 11827]
MKLLLIATAVLPSILMAFATPLVERTACCGLTDEQFNDCVTGCTNDCPPEVANIPFLCYNPCAQTCFLRVERGKRLLGEIM